MIFLSEKKYLDRASYKKIKAMNRDEMQDFLGKLSDEIACIASEDTTFVDTEALRKDIGKIKGIGETRLDEIMKVIESYLTPKQKV